MRVEGEPVRRAPGEPGGAPLGGGGGGGGAVGIVRGGGAVFRLPPIADSSEKME